MNILDRFLLWVGRPEQRMQRCGADRGDLKSDQSGAIMIAGVFMASLLAAGVFYLIGMGNAIVYRERLQDAADAVAYTSAGVHARGMNIIVLINLVMAALLAVLIMMRMLILMLGITIVACGICIAATVFCPLSGVCAAAMPKMIKIEQGLIKGANKYEKVLDKVLPALSIFEKVVAMTTPYVGAYKGNKVSKQYKPLVTTGMALSPSMVPFVPSSKKLGLPVQEMEWDKFCKKSAELAIEHGFGWLPDPVGWILKKIAGAIAGTFSGYFCGGAGASNIQDVMDNKIKEQVNEGCKNQKDDCSDKVKSGNSYPTCTGDQAQDKNTNCMSKYCTDLGGGLAEFNTANCKKDGNQAAKDQMQKTGFDPAGGGMGNTKNKTPKEIWEGAEIGSIWFQTFGFTGGDEQWPRKLDKGLAIATKTGQMPKVQASWGNWRFGQAEFYFDDKGKWSDLKEDCMWKMYWRARLRRFAVTGINLGQLGLGKLFDVMKKYVDTKWIDGAVNGGTSIILGGLGKDTYDKLADKLKDTVVGALGKGVDSAIDGWVMPSWEVIH
ncbi:MAG: Tad domain-containing protein [Polyangiaceae bacterium]|nr:Tad domain-containing protein [Polyangiaceae bacterium]MCL4754862.1 hypothetical protein [Myxococcales bacterium]